jgi:3-dehydroquinate dehydratase II
MSTRQILRVHGNAAMAFENSAIDSGVDGLSMPIDCTHLRGDARLIVGSGFCAAALDIDFAPRRLGYICGSHQPANMPPQPAYATNARATMSRLVYVLNGPNINLLGKRQPHIYGSETLADVERDCRALAAELKLSLTFQQSNREYEIIDWIHEARETAGGIVINPAAFTHTSIALLDALNTFDHPVIEVHISQVHKREAFRQHSYVSLRADAVMAGFGTQGYQLALRRIAHLMDTAKPIKST